MRRDVVVTPENARDDFGAQLFRERDAGSLESAIGVIGSESDPQGRRRSITSTNSTSPLVSVADDLDHVARREQRRRDSIEHRSARRPGETENFQFSNVRLDRGGVSARPSGKRQMGDGGDVELLRVGLDGRHVGVVCVLARIAVGVYAARLRVSSRGIAIHREAVQQPWHDSDPSVGGRFAPPSSG